GYLAAATVFWVNFQYADALKMIEQARVKLGNPSIYAYEAAAIRENQRDYSGALNEYAKGALTEGAGRCRDRLLRLARRKSLAAQGGANPPRLGALGDPAKDGLGIGVPQGKFRGGGCQESPAGSLGFVDRGHRVLLL